MSEEYARALTNQSVARTCVALDFKSAQGGCIETLSEVVRNFVQRVAECAHEHAESTGRVQPGSQDVLAALGSSVRRICFLDSFHSSYYSMFGDRIFHLQTGGALGNSDFMTLKLVMEKRKNKSGINLFRTKYPIFHRVSASKEKEVSWRINRSTMDKKFQFICHPFLQSTHTNARMVQRSKLSAKKSSDQKESLPLEQSRKVWQKSKTREM